MKKAGVACAIGVLLSGCQTGPSLVAFKPGTTFNDRQLAYDQCKIEALQSVPSDVRTQFNPGYYNPGSLSCSTYGSYTSCNRVGAVDIPATATQYDANSSLRQRTIMRCMEAKGYRFLQEVPMCRSDKDRYAAMNSPQPETPQNICNAGRSLEN